MSASRCLLVLALAAPAGAQLVAPAPLELIVEIPRAADRAAVEAEFAREGWRVTEELPALGLLLVRLPDSLPEASLQLGIERLSAMPGVGFAEVNGTGEGGFVPDDTFFPLQWHLDNRGQFGGTAGADIEALRGWDLARGSASVLVAVLDTGLALGNPDFAGRFLPGYDFVNEDDIPADDHGHGTFVTSILAANADNAFGLAGIDHACTLLPVKVLNRRNQGTLFDLAQGLAFAADAGADVISMSLINYGNSSTLRVALRSARDAGCILVACAGNGGIGDADVSQPGSSLLTISVGATTRDDERASFSGTGSRLDLVAPGLEVPALQRGMVEDWVPFSGCSAATPVVSGIVALALSIDPTLTHDEIRALLVAGAEDQVGPAAFDLPGRDNHFGNGRVNLFRTLCGLDSGAPSILGPEVIPIECPVPDGLPGNDPLVTSALAAVVAIDDLDPRPTLDFALPAFVELGTPGPVLFHAQDACGHASERTVLVAMVDTRPPALTFALATDHLAPADGLLHGIALEIEASDACDRGPALELFVYSDEPMPLRSVHDALLDERRGLFLRAKRSDEGDGRVYLCVVRARDDFDNVAARCATLVVPGAGGADALALARAQADLARAVWEATGAPPAGYSLLLSGLLPKETGQSRGGPR